nr:MerR family transcriptional regulator [Streptomyces sp. WMMB 322]
MRIGELAALVGVSTRTVRHYHRLGLLTGRPGRAASCPSTYGGRRASRCGSPAAGTGCRRGPSPCRTRVSRARPCC